MRISACLYSCLNIIMPRSRPVPASISGKTHMKTLKAKAIGIFAGSAMLLGSLVPAAAVPLVSAPAPAIANVGGAPVIDVQSRRNPPAYRGHRGYRDRRPGYRQFNGFWYPMAAFSAGAIIGGSVKRGGRTSHVEWCRAKYRSYRVSDDTYSVGNGRRACISPR